MGGWPFLAIAVEFVIDKMATYPERVERSERNDCNVPGVGIVASRKRRVEAITFVHRYAHDDQIRHSMMGKCHRFSLSNCRPHFHLFVSPVFGQHFEGVWCHVFAACKRCCGIE